MLNLTKGPVLKNILLFSLPIFVGDFLQQLYVIADSIIVGRLLGPDALATVGFASPVYALVTSVFLGVSIGFSILLAHLKGAGKSEAYAKVIASLICTMAVMTLITIVISVFFTDFILIKSGTPKEILIKSSGYLKTLLFGIAANFALLSIGAVLRAFGDTKTPLVISISGSLVNIALDFIFIRYAKSGIQGAAIATVLAQCAASLATLCVSLRLYKVRLSIVTGLRPSFSFVKQAVSYGMPLALQYIFLAGGTLILVRIASPLGITVMGAFTVIGRLESFIALPFLSISSGLTTFTAQNHGASLSARVKEGRTKTLVFITLLTIIALSLFMVFAQGIAGIFTKDSELIFLTKEYLFITCPFLLLNTIMVTLHGSMNGLGKTKVPLFNLYFFLIRNKRNYK